MKKSKKQTYDMKDKLLYEIEQAKIAYNTALSNLEYITDPDLIDCYIYELNAAGQRYKFLLVQARNYGLRYSNYSDFPDIPLAEPLLAAGAE